MEENYLVPRPNYQSERNNPAFTIPFLLAYLNQAPYLALKKN